jgi:signal transduction histidine kinase
LAATGVACAYWAAGKAGLLLAIPPGYATAVWPASGIALGALLVCGSGCSPGIAVGSFLVNVGTSLDASTGTALARSLALAGAIGMGAALQALWGVRLARRFAAFPDPLSDEGRVIRLVLLGGPVSCLFNATWGVTFLWAAGLVSTSLLLTNWWTWWVGDTIGVMIFMPLILLFAAPDRPGWRRRLLVAGPLLVVFAVVVALFVRSSRSEYRRIHDEFEATAREIALDLETDLERDLENLYALEGFFMGSTRVDRGEFTVFTRPLLARHPDLQGISWDERVPASGRASFEERLAREGFGRRGIVSRTRSGLVSSAPRDEYVPVTYVEPLEANRDAVGYDVSSSPQRREAMLRSLRERRPAATAPVNLIQGGSRRRGILVFHPVFMKAADVAPAGYAVDIFRLRPMLEARLNRALVPGAVMSLFDDQAVAARRLLYGDRAARGVLETDVPVSMAGRIWRLHVSALPAYLVEHRSMEAWHLLAGGLFLAGLLGILLLVVTGRTERVEAEVALRTAELRAGQSEREELLKNVQSANRELSDFAHIVSHDLKAPLRGISGLAGWVLEDHGPSLGEEGRGQLEMLQARVRRMSDMIDGILQYSRIGRTDGEREDVDVGALVGAVVDLLSPPAGVEVLSPGTLPVVRAVPVRLQQVFQNLIGNAIKHMDKPEGRVEVSCVQDGGRWRFCVSDDGPGIEERHFEKIFQIFQTLAPRDKTDSTGVGLAIVKKIVQSEGGRVWVESAPGRGARFYFTWPQRPVCVGEAGPVPSGTREFSAKARRLS